MYYDYDDGLSGMTIFLIVSIVVYFIVNIIMAVMMSKAAKEKGYDQYLSGESYTASHAGVVTFFIGIAGCIYVAALPDLIQRELQKKLMEILKVGGSYEQPRMNQQDDELPDL